MKPSAALLTLSLVALSGCATSRPALEAPDQVAWGGPLAEAHQVARQPADAPPPGTDAEAGLARGGGWTSSSLPPRQRPSLDPGSAGGPGVGVPGVRDPGASEPGASEPGASEPGASELARLLAALPILRVPARLAVVEAWRPHERWEGHGDPLRTQAVGGLWTLRPPLPAGLAAFRRGLDPLAAAGDGQDWPALEAPRRDPFAAIDAVPGLLLPREASLGGARRAAARIGSDVLLVYGCAARVYAWRNGWANLYPTLVGLLAPGEARAAVVRAEGALVDVRSGAILAVAQAESRRETSHAPLLGGGPEEEAGLLEEASGEALAGLAAELRRALAGLEAAGRFAPATPAAEGSK